MSKYVYIFAVFSEGSFLRVPFWSKDSLDYYFTDLKHKPFFWAWIRTGLGHCLLKTRRLRMQAMPPGMPPSPTEMCCCKMFRLEVTSQAMTKFVFSDF